MFCKTQWRNIHSGMEENSSGSDAVGSSEDSQNGEMNDFLSRFVWIMRGKLYEAYPDCEKDTMNGMLLVIVSKVLEEIEKSGLEHMPVSLISPTSYSFSGDLWNTVWEVSRNVINDIRRARKKDKLKVFLHSEGVKEMCRFSSQIGVRGDMLRKLRFKWAEEKMDETEFYHNLERIRDETLAQEEMGSDDSPPHDPNLSFPSQSEESEKAGEKPELVSFPKRQGKIKYRIYGLDLSGSHWREMAERIHQAGEVMWPQEAKPLFGECKLLTEKILKLKEEEDWAPLINEWVKLLQPSRVDWFALLDRMKRQNPSLYFKVGEWLLDQDSFGASIGDYSALMNGHAVANRIDDMDRILTAMRRKGMSPDILTSAMLVGAYAGAGDADRAAQSFEDLKRHDIDPDAATYETMIMAYTRAGRPLLAERLAHEMVSSRRLPPSGESYMSILRSFARAGDVNGASRVAVSMHFAGLHPTAESCAVLVELHGRAGDVDEARLNFDAVVGSGASPDDACIAAMVSAYETKNMLDRALDTVLRLGDPGPATLFAMAGWLARLGLVTEAEQMAARSCTPVPVRTHAALCAMYSRSGDHRKAMGSLAVVEENSEALAAAEFEHLVHGLLDGGLKDAAKRVHRIMLSKGLTPSQSLRFSLKLYS